jgi:polar amino acid transport system substrate-binding protein
MIDPGEPEQPATTTTPYARRDAVRTSFSVAFAVALRSWTLLVLTLLAVTALARPTRADTLTDVRARGEIRWGGDLQGGEPYVFEDPRNPKHIVGFEVDIADALARRMGLARARFVQMQWSNLVPALERGDVDLALNGLEDTPERRARLRLSRPYFLYRETLAVRAGAPYRTLDDLRGKRVGTLNQTYALELLRARPLEAVLYEGQQEPYYDLQLGRVEAVLLDHIIADRYGCPLKGISCLPGEVAHGTYVVGLRRGDEALAGAVDAALGSLIEDGELRRILTQWKLWDDTQQALGANGSPEGGAGSPAESASASATAPSAAATATAAEPAPFALPEARTIDSQQVLLFLQAAGITLVVSFASFALAMPLGMLLAAVRLGSGPVGRSLAAGYVEVFRGTPVLLQLYVLYYGLAPVFRLDAMTASILGLGLNYAAYEAEVYRGAMLAIPRGQIEAAAALGLGPWQTLRHVMIPQAARTALPAVTNDFVSLLKDSSLVSMLTVVELTKRMTITSVEIRSWIGPGLLCAALYFAMSFPLSRLSRWLERRLHHDPHPRLA